MTGSFSPGRIAPGGDKITWAQRLTLKRTLRRTTGPGQVRGEFSVSVLAARHGPNISRRTGV